MYAHRASTRFKRFKVQSVDILFEGKYSECEAQEASFIELYDTFGGGLNNTADGKGILNDKQLTNKIRPGDKHQYHTKIKMKDAWTEERKQKHKERHTGWNHSHETRRKLSEQRKGKINGPEQISQELKDEIRQFFINITYTNDDLRLIVAKKYINLVGTVDLPQLSDKTGLPLTDYLVKYKLTCKKYNNITPRHISNIILKKTVN